MRFVDIAAKLSGRPPDARLVRILGYDALAVEGLRRYGCAGKVALIPRYTFTLETIDKVPRGNVLRIFRADSKASLKLTNRVVALAHAIEVGGNLLARLGRKEIRKIANTVPHVVVRADEVYLRLVNAESLEGLDRLLRAYEAGRVNLSMGSGGNYVEGTGLKHGVVLAALLVTLGLSEAKALASVTSNPRELLRCAGYAVR